MPLVEGHFAVNRARNQTGLGARPCYGGKMKRISLALPGLAVLLSACASDTVNYPSLARRDVERAAATSAPSPAPPPAPVAEGPDPALSARLAGMVAAAREAHRRFAEARERAERSIAAGTGAAPGSEAWATASIALAGLESARSDAMIALADLDALYAEARVSGSGNPGAIASARDEVGTLIGEEDRVLADLRGRLGT